MSNLIVSGGRLTPARLGAQWISYTPTWTATSSNPSIGNGVIVARYRQMSTTVTYSGRITIGSTTTVGSGAWRISLPIAAVDSGYGAGSGVAYDASTNGNRRPVVVWFADTQTLRIEGDTGDVDGSNPFAWASGDQLRWTFEYEGVV